jgi:hypothetical protein
VSINAVNLNTILQISQQGSGISAGSALQIPKSFKSILGAGNLLDQCDTIHAKQYVFVPSTPQVIDLKAGIILDLLGNPAAFSTVRLIAIRLLTQVDGAALIIGDAVTTEWDAFLSAAGTLKVFPGTAANDGFWILAAPNTTAMPVTSSSKSLKMDPDTAAFTAEVIIAGNA